jgi:hypothetical protein
MNSYLQVDKFQHIFGSYAISSIEYNLFMNAGWKKKNALLLSGALGVVLLTPKEIIDGFYNPGGFSWGDLAANIVGSTLFVGQQFIFEEQVLKYKISYSRSEYIKQANGFLGNNLVQNLLKDPNGYTFWISVNVNKFILKTKLPDYISIAAGYSANGMFGPYENLRSYHSVDIPETIRYRQFLFSLDIDWSKIKTRSKFANALLKGLNFIKIPFPAIEFNSKGEIKGYWLYF